MVLILTVGLVNGVGWALCQCWTWAPATFPGSTFNFWRCWESSGGISIGIAYGIAYFLVNRRMSVGELKEMEGPRSVSVRNVEGLLVFLGLSSVLYVFLSSQLGGWGRIYFGASTLFAIIYFLIVPTRPLSDRSTCDPNLERWGLHVGLLMGLGLSIRNGLKGWCNLYLGNEQYWSRQLWIYLGPVFLALLIAISVCVLWHRLPRGRWNPRAYGIIWLVLIVQNVIAQLVTGPLSQWNEMAFSIYYVLLFFISATITYHYYYVGSAVRTIHE